MESIHNNWFAAIGTLFLIISSIVIVRQIIIWGPEFVLVFVINSEITNEKVSLFMAIFGVWMILIGLKHKNKINLE
ncbi:MAG: hypothetical protein KAF24_02945 [Nitrosopumilaceae archaeon]|nr:hypothetical protein [Nitrosopumilaceae archaeon]